MLNHIVLMGRLTRDPELRRTQSGVPVVSFSLAVDHDVLNKETGEPLKIVEHIGCHYAKMFPSKGVGGAEYPYVLAGMVESWGG